MPSQESEANPVPAAERFRFGQTIRINDDGPYFRGQLARISYIGTEGVSVYLSDSESDECIPLKFGEFEVL